MSSADAASMDPQAILSAGQDAVVRALQAQHGAFSLGAFDPNSQTGFAAVDRFAIRTMCYTAAGRGFRFDARADALADGATPIDPQALFHYLHFHCIPAPKTIFRNVFRVPAGHYAWFERGAVTVKPYWTPRFQDVPSRSSFDDLRREFLELLEDAVRSTMDPACPASFLSGGTDSSTVAGLLTKVAAEPTHTFSIGFDAQGYDEMAYARIAARHFGAQHHEYYVTPDDLVRAIPSVARSYDQPFGNSSALPAYYCARMAREHGVKRMLAGDGGDELFGGNSRYAKQRMFDAYASIPDFLRAGLLEPLVLAQALRDLPLVRKAASYVEQARVPMPDRLNLYNLIHRLGLANLLTPEFLSRIDLEGPSALQREVWASASTDSVLNRTLAYDWRFTLADCDLPKVRETTSLAQVDVAFPLLDQRLVDFSLRLPPDYKLKGLKLRWFFKEALRGFLPEEIIQKKKQGFGLPFGVWTLGHPGLREFASSQVNRLAGRGVIRPDFVRDLLDKRLAEHPGYYGEMVWILMMLEQWWGAHEERTGARVSI